MRILVTGGTGFIGSHLVRRLVSENHEVVVVGSTGEQRMDESVKALYVPLHDIDWAQIGSFDAVFHQAANNDAQSKDRTEMWQANVIEPMELFNRLMDSGCKKFVYASSTAVYGKTAVPWAETSRTDPRTPYANSKLAFDEFAMKFKDQVSIIGLRYANVYGPGEEHKGHRKSMVGQMIDQALAGDRVKLFRPGTQRRDWVYISDVIDVNMLAFHSDKSGIYNIGTSWSWSFNELFDIIKEELDKPIVIKYTKPKFDKTYQAYTQCNIRKAMRELEYDPKVSIRQGIKKYIEYLNQQKSPPKRAQVS